MSKILRNKFSKRNAEFDIENCKTLMREIKGYLNKWRGILTFMDLKTKYCQNDISSKIDL